METLLQDLRYGIRTLLKDSGFAAVAVLSLALGIAANSTIFSVINSVMLRPVPYENPEQLVALSEIFIERGQPDWSEGATTANFLDWRQQNQVFEQMAWMSPGLTMSLVTHAGPERIQLQFHTPNLFQLLGVKGALGRAVLEEDARVENNILLSHAFWQRRFGGDPQVLGQTLTLNGYPVTVVGVLSPVSGFWGFGDIDVWQPIDPNKPEWLQRTVRWVFALARLKAGVSLQQAQAGMDVIARQLEHAYPDTNKGWGVKVRPLRKATGVDSPLAGLLYPLFGAVAFVLLIACANIANLLLARASKRQKEMALRASLGAGRIRLIRQLLTESVLLSFVGGILGLLLVDWGIQIYVSLMPEMFSHTREITIDGTVLSFTLGVSLLTGIVFGLTPAWQASKPDLNESLKEGGRSSAGGSRRCTQKILVVSQVSLALVLLMGAGLMIKTFLSLQNVHPGFHADQLLTAEIRLSGPRYVESAPKREVDMHKFSPQMGIFCQQVLKRIYTLPGVQSAAMIDWLPMMMGGGVRTFMIAGQPAPPQEPFVAAYSAATPEYFTTMQIPLLRGRGLTERDVEAAPWVVVINEAMARQFWPDQDPIGQVITLDIVKEERPREIVGVVGNVRQRVQVEPMAGMYVSHLQQPGIYPGNLLEDRLHKSLVLRTAARSTGLENAVRKAVAELDKDQPVYGIRTMQEIMATSISPLRFYVLLLGAFAALALVLAMMGIYGVISYSVNERTHEIGVRMALGAQPQDVLKLILKQGLILSLIGVVVGLAASLAATRILSSLLFLFVVKVYDPVTYAVVSLLLIGVAVLATYIPARRATQVDPMVALRHE